MKTKTSQWLIRSKKGKIQGPITTREVIFKIKAGELDGTESISSYPGGRWQSIGNNSDFYDYLLENLSQENKEDEDQTNWDADSFSLEIKSNTQPPKDEVPEEALIDELEKKIEEHLIKIQILN